MSKIVNLGESASASKTRGTAKLSLFPTKWDSELQATEETFNAVLRELGRVTVAYNHMDQEVFDVLSFLSAGPNPVNADYAVAAKVTDAVRGFETKLKLILSLYAATNTAPAEQQRLDQILKACLTQHKKRNTFLHSRWALPQKGSAAAAVRAKFHQGKDKYEDVTMDQLQKVVRDTEACTKRLNDFLSEGAFSDFWQWTINRVLD
jgi:hypothetical protein